MPEAPPPYGRQRVKAWCRLEADVLTAFFMASQIG
nr:MAG TPA: hypothetical protein [Bacteriophage sp.]